MNSIFYTNSPASNSTVTCETCGRDIDFISDRTSCPQCRGTIRYTHYPDIHFCLNCNATFNPDEDPVCPSCGLHYQNIICKQCGESYRLHPLQTNGYDCPFCGENNSWPSQGAMATDYYSTTEYPTTDYPTTEYPTTEYPTTLYPTTEYPTDYPTTEYPDSDYPARHTFFFTSDLILRDRDKNTTLTYDETGINIVLDDAIFTDKNVCVDRIEFVVDDTHSYFVEHDYMALIQLQNRITVYAELDKNVMRIDLTKSISSESRTFPATTGINIQLEEKPKHSSANWEHIYKFPYYQNSKQQPLSHVTGVLKKLPTSAYPTTEYPTTEYPTTEYPTTEYPTTEYPTTEYPTTEYHSPTFFQRTEDDLIYCDRNDSSFIQTYNTEYMWFNFDSKVSEHVILDKIELAVDETQINWDQYDLIFVFKTGTQVLPQLNGSLLSIDLSAENIPDDTRIINNNGFDFIYEWRDKINGRIIEDLSMFLPLWLHSQNNPLVHVTGRRVDSTSRTRMTSHNSLNRSNLHTKTINMNTIPINKTKEAAYPSEYDSLSSSSCEPIITIYPVKNLAASNENEEKIYQPCTMFLTDNAWDHLADVPIPEQGGSGASNMSNTGIASLNITFGGYSSAEFSSPPGQLRFFHSSLNKSIATPEDLIFSHISQRRLEAYTSPTGKPQDALQARIQTEDGFSRITDFTLGNEGERTGHAQNFPERLRKVQLAPGDNCGLDSINVHFEETLGDGTLVRYSSDYGSVAAVKRPNQNWTNWQHLENELLIFRKMRDGSDAFATIGSDLNQPPAQYPGYIRQLWTPTGLLDIRILGEYSYSILWFAPEDIADYNSDTYIYNIAPDATPLKTWTVEGTPIRYTINSQQQKVETGTGRILNESDLDNLSELCITEQRGDLRFVTRWKQPNNYTLTTIKGEGAEARSTTSTQEATDIVDPYEIMQEGILPDTACWKIGETFTREIKETVTISGIPGSRCSTYRRFPFGDMCLSEENGIGTDTTSSIYYFYDTDPDSRTYGCKLREEHSNGKTVEYNYDRQKRVIMKKEPWFNGDFLITRTTYCNSKYNDQRIASVSEYLQSLGDNVPLNKIMYAYGATPQERWEKRTVLATGYRDGTSRFKPQIAATYWYGENPATNGSPCPQAATRLKMKQSADGLQKTYDYENTDDQNLTFKCTVTQTVEGAIIAGKSTRTVYYYDEAQKLYRKQEYVHTGSEFSLVAEESYERDISGRITRTILPDGRQKTAEWICSGPLEETDENGITTHYRYDSTKTLVEVTRDAQSCPHPGKPNETFQLPAQINSYHYDAAGRMVKETSKLGNKVVVTEKQYDALNRLCSQESDPYIFDLYTYSSDGLKKTSVIQGGSICISEYHTNGEVLSESGAGQRARYYTYACDGNKIVKKTFVDTSNGPLESEVWTSGAGHVVMTGRASGNGSFLRKTRKFDEKGRSYEEQTGDLAPILTEYDALGTPVRETWKLPSPRKKRMTETETRYVKTTLGDSLPGIPDIFRQPLVWRQTTVKNLIEGETQNTVSEMTAELASRNIPGILSATLKRNKYGRETLNWLEISSGQQYQYEIIPESPVRNMAVRMDGWMLYDKRREGSKTAFGYEFLSTGERHSMTDERGNTSIVELNLRGQKTLFRDAENKETKWIYNMFSGILQKEINPAGKTKEYLNDQHRNFSHIFGTEPHPQEFTYDTADRLISIKTLRRPEDVYVGWNPFLAPPQWDTTTFSYDPASGALLKKQMPDGSNTTYTYNHRGQIQTLTQARGIKTTYTYAPGTGELLTVSHSDGTPGITYTYNDRGQVHTITDASGTRTFTYNDKFDPETESTTRNRPTRLSVIRNSQGIETGYELKVNGKAIQHVQYRRDGRARLAGIRQNKENPYSFTYKEGSALPEKMIYPNEMIREQNYHLYKNLPQSLTYTLPGNTRLEQETYSFDTLGRLTSRNRTIENNSGAPAGTHTHAYGYNDRNEVISDQPTGSQPWICSYDNAGNRIQSQSNGQTIDYSANALNQYTALSANTATGIPDTFTPAYDEDGNQLSLETDTGEWTVTWNANNRPIQFIQGQKRIECVYDSSGRRTEKSEYTGNTLQKRIQYIYRGTQLIAEANNSDTWIKTWLWNPAPSNASTPLSMNLIDENNIQEPNIIFPVSSSEQKACFSYESISEYPESLFGLEPTSRDLYFHGYDGQGEITLREGGDTLYIEAQIPAGSRFRMDTLKALLASQYNPPQVTLETILKIGISSGGCEQFSATATWNNGIISADFAAAGITNERRTFAASDPLNFYVVEKNANTGVYHRYLDVLADRDNHSFVQVTGTVFSDNEEYYEQTFYPVDDLPQLHETPFYYQNDINKNITAVTGADCTVKEAYIYDPFGNARLLKTNPNTQQKNPFRFSSEYFDEELGLIYYNYRHYNPKDGRWLSREPLGEQESANLYRFVDNNPVNTIDSEGLAKTIPWEEYLERIYFINNLNFSYSDTPADTARKFRQALWTSKMLSYGCVGIPSVMAGGHLTRQNCFETRQEAISYSTKLNTGLYWNKNTGENNPNTCCAIVYSIHLWNHGEIKLNENGGLKKTEDGKIDLKDWDKLHKNGSKGGFDYGYLVGDVIYSATSYHNPATSPNSETGVYFGNLPVIYSKIIASNLTEWSDQIKSKEFYNTEVWCTECRKSNFGEPFYTNN